MIVLLNNLITYLKIKSLLTQSVNINDKRLKNFDTSRLYNLIIDNEKIFSKFTGGTYVDDLGSINTTLKDFKKDAEIEDERFKIIKMSTEKDKAKYTLLNKNVVSINEKRYLIENNYKMNINMRESL